MIDKVLYRCSRCGHTYLDAGDGAITPKGEQVDGVVPVCAECFVSNVTRESAHMVQVWPPRWIPVEERLPERRMSPKGTMESDFVLLLEWIHLASPPTITVAFLCDGVWFEKGGKERAVFGMVTHWAEVPTQLKR